MAHKFAAQASPLSVEAISAVVMPEAARAYGIRSTPHIVLDGRRHLRGRVDEQGLLAALLAHLA